MTVTLELPPEVETAAKVEAQAQGVAVEDYLQSFLKAALPRRPAEDAETIRREAALARINRGYYAQRLSPSDEFAARKAEEKAREERPCVSSVDVLANVLGSRFHQVAIRVNYGWPNNAALSVIDCVLSLNRRYDGFVLPRVETFARQWPDIVELAQLSEMLNGCTRVGDFCLRELNYNHAEREQTLRGVLKYMISAQAKQVGEYEWERLQAWAASSKPSDYIAVGVSGFGLSGFQYMRMLFGAQTTKPDIHVIRFVSEVVGRKVSDVQALQLLEAASAKAGLPLREVDGAIWEAGARGLTME